MDFNALDQRVYKHLGKPYTQTTIDSDFSKELHNILNEQFNPEQPDAVWVSDITYIWTFEGFVYLTSIMDLYSRKIIAWVLSETLEASHVVECIEKAKKIRRITHPLMIHTDYVEKNTILKFSFKRYIKTVFHIFSS